MEPADRVEDVSPACWEGGYYGCMNTKTASCVIDEIMHYKGLWNCDCHCRVHVYDRGAEPPVVVFTEALDNPGTSVTNYIEYLVDSMVQRLGRKDIVVIEHYLPTEHIQRAHPSGDWDLVTFDGHAPDWAATSPESILAAYGVDVLAQY